MAGDWIKVREDLKDDPAVLRMSKALGLDPWGIVGRLSDIWAWIGRHTADGEGVPVDADMIDARLQAPGFAAAMRTVGWLAGEDGALCFPVWERHNSRSAKARALEAEAKTLRRRMSDKTSDKCPTEPPQSVGPEKRREDIGKPPQRASKAAPENIEAVRLLASRFQPTSTVREKPDAGFIEWWWDEGEKRGWVDRESGAPWSDWEAAFRAAWRAHCHNNIERKNKTYAPNQGHGRGSARAPLGAATLRNPHP